MMSATHNVLGANAAKCLFTGSIGHDSFGADRVVFGDFARRTPLMSIALMRRSTVQ